jgi:hypothetical protein
VRDAPGQIPLLDSEGKEATTGVHPA